MQYRKITIATDKFKGTLTAAEAASAVKDGILTSCTESGTEPPEILLRPMADGGEGSLDVMKRGMTEAGVRFQEVRIPTVNHIGQPAEAPVLLFGEKNAFFEMASVCGLNLVPHDRRDLLHSSTYGIGEVFRSLIEDRGIRRIMLSIGGSGTNDGGFGMLSALGYRFANSNPFRNKDIPTFMKSIDAMMDSGVDAICPHLRETRFEVACDVANPLLGPSGATAVYGPQKGGTEEGLALFEEALGKWADTVEEWMEGQDEPTPFDRYSEGAGAAGGIGFALGTVLKASMKPGWEFFSSMLNLEQDIASSDLVITGEGRFDESSLAGKLPYGIAELCRKHRKPLWVVTGRNRLPKSIWRPSGFNEVTALNNTPHTNSDTFTETARLLSEAVTARFSRMDNF